MASWLQEVPTDQARPGDLLLYRTCSQEPCAYQHVALMLADGLMLHTNRCGDVAHVTGSRGTDPESGFAGARRVMPEAAR